MLRETREKIRTDGKRILFFFLLLLNFCCFPLFSGQEEPKGFGSFFRGDSYAWYIPHKKGPLKIRVSCYGQNGGVLGRFFDAEGRLAKWHYSGVEGTAEFECDFGNHAPTGLYQFRCAFRGVRVRIMTYPEHTFGIMPVSSWLYAENPQQFRNCYFTIPASVKELKYELRGGGVVFRDQNGTILRGKMIPHSSGKDDVWSAELSLKEQWDHSFRILGFPAVLSPDKETAEAIASLMTHKKGAIFPFQIQAAGRLALLQKDLPPIPQEDLSRYAGLLKDPGRDRYLFGRRGILSCFKRMIDRTDGKPDLSRNMALAAFVWSLDRPFNPWYHDPALEKRILEGSLKFLLSINEMEQISGSGWGWSGSTSVVLLGQAAAFGTMASKLSPEDRALWAEGLRRVADRYPFYPSSRESATSRWPLIYLYLAKGTGMPVYRRIAEDYIKAELAPENSPTMRTGYQREGLGCDPYAQGESVLWTALYFRMTGSPAAKEGLRRIFRFLNHSVYPVGQGRFVSACNFASVHPSGWEKRRYAEAGVELLKGFIPDAACWPGLRDEEDSMTMEDLLRVSGGDASTAVMPDAPYFTRFLTNPGTPLHGIFPVQEKRPFIRHFNGEFTAVMTGKSYLFIYNGRDQMRKHWIGRYFLKYDGRKRPRTWERRQVNEKWDIVPGLAMAASPQWGPFIVSKSWNGRTLHMVIHEGGKNALPVYPDFLNSTSEKYRDGSVKITTAFRSGSGPAVIRKIVPLADGARITLTVPKRLSRSGRLMEQIPFVRYVKTDPAWLRDGKWSLSPGRTKLIRFGEHFYLRFEKNVESFLAEDTDADGIRMGCLRIPLDEHFPAEGPLEFTYEIRFR